MKKELNFRNIVKELVENFPKHLGMTEKELHDFFKSYTNIELISYVSNIRNTIENKNFRIKIFNLKTKNYYIIHLQYRNNKLRDFSVSNPTYSRILCYDFF